MTQSQALWVACSGCSRGTAGVAGGETSTNVHHRLGVPFPLQLPLSSPDCLLFHWSLPLIREFLLHRVCSFLIPPSHLGVWGCHRGTFSIIGGGPQKQTLGQGLLSGDLLRQCSQEEPEGKPDKKGREGGQAREELQPDPIGDPGG